ncbi:MAG: cobalamin-dependent protein, partial [Victivallales bacterium]|nr:cobalamin-dependent protein [Victivallales bacterium]
MKVTLISTNTAGSPYPVYPLGCAVIASALSRAGNDVRIFDCMMESEKSGGIDEMLGKFECEIRRFKPDFIGISIRNIDNVNTLEEETFLDVPKRIVEIAKRLFPNMPSLLGGSGYSIMPVEILDTIEADYGIAGEGEEAVLEFAAAVAKGVPPSERIMYRTQHASSAPPLRGESILGAEYSPKLAKFYNAAGCVMPVQTKRGCSNRCVYCTYPLLEGSEPRRRPAETVLNDIRKLRDDFGADMIFFTDSVFNDSQGGYLEMVEAMERERMDSPWTAFFQPNSGLTENLADRLANIGLQSVELGPDATSDATLKAIGKSFDFNEVIRCNNLFADRNIAV